MPIRINRSRGSSTASPATGAKFALLPPENATGNFTKIVQRVPVKIRIPDPGALAGKLLPGLSTEVIVDTRTLIPWWPPTDGRHTTPQLDRGHGGLIGAFMAILDIQITNASLKDIQGHSRPP